jgi:hypothetical protein
MHWRRLIFPFRRRIPHSIALKVTKSKNLSDFKVGNNGMLWEIWISKDERFKEFFVITRCTTEGKYDIVLADYMNYRDPNEEIRKLEGN